MVRAAVFVMGIGLVLLLAGPAHAADEIVVFIDVAGAPGDGEKALTKALKRWLATEGVKAASAPAVGVYEVQGTVRVTPAKRGKENVRIDWTVFGPEGTRLGMVTQTKIIRKGSLNRRWGAAAGAAARDIFKLLPHSSAPAPVKPAKASP